MESLGEVFPQMVDTKAGIQKPLVAKSGPEGCIEGENIPFRIVDELIDIKYNGPRLELLCSTKIHINRTVWTHETSMHQLTESKDKVGLMIFCIEFWDDDVFRIRFNNGNEIVKPIDLSDMATTMLTGQPKNDMVIKVVEDEEKILVHTLKVELQINRSPFCMEAKSNNGTLLWKQKGYEYFAINNFRSSTASVNGVIDCFESLSLDYDECIYGFGERFDYVERKGKALDLWNKDAIGSTSGRTYINIPFMWSTKGYGLFINNYGKTYCEVGTRETGTLTLGVEDGYMDYFVICSQDPKVILKKYSSLTGFSPTPPVWTFGLWMSRNSYLSWDIVHGVAADMQKHQIPFDVLHLDSAWFKENFNCDLRFCPDRFPEPEKHIKKLREQGYRVSLWQYNFVPPKENNANYVEGREKGYFAMGKDGELFKYPDYVIGSWVDDAIIDFSNPEAVKWYTCQIKELIRMGASAIKTDFAEGIPEEAVYKNIDGKKFHNYYSLIYNHVIDKAIKEVSSDATVWARSGTAGSQRYPIHWGGDSQSTWNGLSGTLKGGLALGLSGIPFYSHDIGGFIGRPSSELYIRWAQLGFFSSHARCHGMGDNNKREPWSFGEQACAIFKKYADLRYRLLPYIYAQSIRSSETGLPLMRALILEYPQDRNVYHIEDQYMFGNDMLVAPILFPMKDKQQRGIYLPKGRWVDFWTGEMVDSNGTWVVIDACLEIMPIYVKANAVIPYTGKRSSTENKIGQIQGLEVYPDASGTWHHNDGENILKVNVDTRFITIESENGADVSEVYAFSKQQPTCMCGNGKLNLITHRTLV